LPFFCHICGAPELDMTSHPEFGARTDGKTVAGAFRSAIKGKTILITGISLNGLGMSTAEALATQEPALLILTGRSREKVQKVIDQLSAQYPATAFRFLCLNLTSQKQVRQAAEDVMAYPDVPQIDIVICNAGVMAVQTRELCEDGIEMHLATNHVGHFLFINLIMEKLKASAKTSTPGSTRVINISSFALYNSPVRFSDPNFEKEQEDLPPEERPNLAAMARFNLPTSGQYK
jgi:NAD(P)-dependent dehydrogenase (short-subunit alcohol dehydrogenase family)